MAAPESDFSCKLRQMTSLITTSTSLRVDCDGAPPRCEGSQGRGELPGLWLDLLQGKCLHQTSVFMNHAELSSCYGP
ncbi:Hypothetical protein SMAX5B_000778 [Scophthalmus maximus]|uniref:Uncharacterized protein n=1 Tax=Scophthalmus maximus TaxID=52904 RepID=A0A2U9BW59_SCOMX|nr:Hypothetical protein SMAX5B_000778 [Scophthalmus maximus]